VAEHWFLVAPLQAKRLWQMGASKTRLSMTQRATRASSNGFAEAGDCKHTLNNGGRQPLRWAPEASIYKQPGKGRADVDGNEL